MMSIGVMAWLTPAAGALDLASSPSGQLFLHLAPCSASDPNQVWSGDALLHQGQLSAIKNEGAGLCLSSEEDVNNPTGDPVVVGPCDTVTRSFQHDGSGRVWEEKAWGAACLDANKGIGPDFLLWECHAGNSPDVQHQQFTFESGLLRSVSSPLSCMTVSDLALPRLDVHPGAVVTTGASSGGDMAIQMHVAYSASVSGVCGFDAQPYHCAATRFPGDSLIPQSSESSVPHCTGCPPGFTLVYDHCKNHPEWVDVGMLPDYPRRTCHGRDGCVDEPGNLRDTTVYLSRGECETYVGGAVINSVAMYSQFVNDSDTQILYTDSCAPDVHGSTDEKCFQHVFGPNSKATRQTGHVPLVPPADQGKVSNIRAFSQAPFIEDFNVGFHALGWLYVPDSCQAGIAPPPGGCRLIIHFHGCGGSGPPGENDLTVRYAENNDIVLLHPVIKKFNNVSRTFGNANEIQRGCWDGYGQLSEDFALQSAPHMRSVFRMLEHLVSGHEGVFV